MNKIESEEGAELRSRNKPSPKKQNSLVNVNCIITKCIERTIAIFIALHLPSGQTGWIFDELYCTKSQIINTQEYTDC